LVFRSLSKAIWIPQLTLQRKQHETLDARIHVWLDSGQIPPANLSDELASVI